MVQWDKIARTTMYHRACYPLKKLNNQLSTVRNHLFSLFIVLLAVLFFSCCSLCEPSCLCAFMSNCYLFCFVSFCSHVSRTSIAGSHCQSCIFSFFADWRGLYIFQQEAVQRSLPFLAPPKNHYHLLDAAL